MRRRAARLALSLGFAAMVVACSPSGAWAGSYTVHGCRTPDGGVAAIDSWVVSQHDASLDHAVNTCPQGGLALSLDPSKAHPVGDLMDALFTAPADTVVLDYTLWISGQVGQGTSYGFTGVEMPGLKAVPPACLVTAPCTGFGDPSHPISDANRVSKTTVGPVSGVGLVVGCSDTTSGCPAAPVAVTATLYRADVVLGDAYPPAFASPPTGGLLDSTTTLSGTQSVSALVADRGSGVSSLAVEVDGNVMAQDVIGDAKGTCRPPYTTRVPCEQIASGTVRLDTASLSQGAHQVRVLASDAAGNVTPWGPVTVNVANADPSCTPTPVVTGAGRITAWARAPRRHHERLRKERPAIRIRYGARPTVGGRLTDPSKLPMAGSPVCLAWRPGGSSGAYRPLARVATDATGRFATRLPSGPSRDILAISRTAGGALTARARVQVVPKLTLRQGRRSLRNGQVLTLRGRLRGGPFPPRGALVRMEVRVGRQWQVFKEARTRAGGRYRTAWRFRHTTGVQRYTLRARVIAQAGYPYATGISKRIHVFVRG